MDLIFIEKPILALFVLVPVMVLHAAAYIMRGRKLCILAELLNVAFHSVSVYVIWLMGGGFEDSLVLVLFSAVVSLLRFRPEKEEKGGKDK